MPILRRAHILLPIAGLIAGGTLSNAAPNKHAMVNTTSCSTHSIAPPDVFGVKVLSLTAAASYDEFISPAYSGGAGPPLNVTVSYCGVNLTYTHPGWGDTINVQVWLPLTGWNGRFQGLGGGGWSTGYGAMTLAPAVSEGYAAATTDGGHTMANPSPVSWGLRSPGNVDHYLLQDFASVTLSDMTIIGKQITEQYYQTPPQYSYWNGCSTGGRQGLMLAQRYPSLYDGIMARAPAINWDTFIIGEYWMQQVMNRLGVYPDLCEIHAFTRQALSVCDALDGIEDGVIADDAACKFDPYSIIGSTFLCDGTEERKFTLAGATVVEAAWAGPTDASGKRYGYGLSHDAPLEALFGSSVDANGTRNQNFPISREWIQTFVMKDQGFPLQNMTSEEYFELFHKSRNEYASIIGTSDPDLSSFKALGGKIITWHGLADELIPPDNSVEYYKRVLEEVPDTYDFYRLFELPGVWHCGSGPGYQAVGDIDALVQWVEEGVAPEFLQTANTTTDGNATQRLACLWPKNQSFVGIEDSEGTAYICK